MRFQGDWIDPKQLSCIQPNLDVTTCSITRGTHKSYTAVECSAEQAMVQMIHQHARHFESLFPFTRCPTEINFHPRFLVLSGCTHLQISPTCRFHLHVDFTYLQISPTCRFHLLAIALLIGVAFVTSYKTV